MGQLADDVVAGFCCSLCMVYFEKEHGYPVLCEDCYNDLSKKERKEYAKAAIKEM